MFFFCAVPLLSLAGGPENSSNNNSAGLFAGFSQRCNQRVVYRHTARVSLATHTADGKDLIILDYSLQNPARRFERNFLAAHECAHHLLGDTTPESILARQTVAGMVAMQELRADCWAAGFLASAGLEADVKKMAESLYRLGREMPGGGYPSGVERAVRLRHCGQTIHRK